jgi:hypothetical protein
MHTTSSKCILVENYFSNEECDQLLELSNDKLLSNLWEPINIELDDSGIKLAANPLRDQAKFYWNEKRSGKYPPKKLNVPDFLKSFCDMLLNENENCGLTNSRWFTCSYLASYPGCQQQPFHFDDKQFADEMLRKKKCRFQDVPFSMLVALESEDNPSRLHIRHINSSPVEDDIVRVNVTVVGDVAVVIPRGGILIFRGDCYHAGDAYSTHNTRLFIATGTDKFLNPGKNLLVLGEEEEKNSAGSAEEEVVIKKNRKNSYRRR